MTTVGMTYASNDQNVVADRDVVPLLKLPAGANLSAGGSNGEGEILIVADTGIEASSTYVGAATGCILVDSQAGDLYINSGNPAAAVWKKVTREAD